MPTYEYVCRSCGERVAVVRTMDQMDDPLACKECGSPCRRVFSASQWQRGPQWEAKSRHAHDAGKPGTVDRP